MNLSPGQMAVLKALKEGPKETSNRTKGSTVSGTASTALAKRGLVTIKPVKDGTNKVTITAKGKKVLAI